MSSELPICVPDEVNLLKLIRCRKEEINAINNECKTKLPKLSQQRLPRYMRRRAASHNPKRIPKACRGKWLSSTTTASGHDRVSQAKEKRRLKMKKHVNDRKLKENVDKRNQREDRSLLHIWFAKRFRLELFWNKLVPIRNNTKNERNLHRMAKSGVCFYYMSPFLRAIEVANFPAMASLRDALSKLVVSEIDGLFDIDQETERTCTLYEVGQYPCGLIGPVSIQLVDTAPAPAKVFIWSHVANNELLLKVLTDLLPSDNGTQITISDLERIRVVGPEVKQKLGLVGFAEEALSSILDKAIGTVITVNRSLQGTLFAPSDDQVSKSAPLIQLINTSLGDKVSVDIVVSRQATKAIWSKLVANKGHLAGGLRDLKSLHFNKSKLLFPFFGSIDCKLAREQDSCSSSKSPKNNSAWIEQFLASLPLATFHVLRDKSILSDLESSGESSKITSAATRAYLAKHQGVLINVEVSAISRGTPTRGDIVCLPTHEDLIRLRRCKEEKFPAEAPYTPNEVTPVKVLENVLTSSRQVIGCIEFGSFDLETGHGKAIAFVEAAHFVDLITLNKKSAPIEFVHDSAKGDKEPRESDKIVLALHRPRNSTTFRFVSLKVIND